MTDREGVLLVLGPGERRRVVMTEATTVRVVAGRVSLRGPIQWLAESVRVPEQWLHAEQVSSIPSGGWVDLMAPNGARLDLVAATTKPWWRLSKSSIGAVFARLVPASASGRSAADAIRRRQQNHPGVARFAGRR